MKMTDLAVRMKEFSCRDAECWLHSCAYTKRWTCILKIRKDGDELKFEVSAETPLEAFEGAYAKYAKVLERIPTYNPNRLIEAVPLSSFEIKPMPDDDIPF